MRSKELLKKQLDYVRFTHLLIMFVAATLIYLFTTIPEKLWVVLTLLMICAGIEPGLIYKRALHRIGGTLSALVILIPLIYFMQLNFRLIPVLFIVSFIGFSVSMLNTDRYYITVFFVTLVIFLLLSQTIEANLSENPFDMAINRAICTLISFFIVFTSDYVLYKTYHYSQKLYFFHQIMIYDFFNEIVQQLMQGRSNRINTFLFIGKLRTELIEYFTMITISSSSLEFEPGVSSEIRQQVGVFQVTIWEIRRLLFALYISEFILQSPMDSKRHMERFNLLMNKARSNFIQEPTGNDCYGQ